MKPDKPIDDEAFLNALVDEALIDDRAESQTRFTHAFVDAELCDVLRAFLTTIADGCEYTPRVNIFGQERYEGNYRLYLSYVESGTILWFQQKSLGIAELISRELNLTVHWISVYEAFCCRAYIRFSNGMITKEVLDPDQYWTRNILSGDDLTGKGPRKFGSYFEFRIFIQDFYCPVEESRDFELIERKLQENELQECVSPLLRVSTIGRKANVELIGNWGTEHRDAILAVAGD